MVAEARATLLERGASEAGSAAGPARARRVAWVVAWLAFVPIAVLRAGTLTESDTFWEIRTGLITIAHRAIPTADPFSWTAAGKPWTLNSWGFNVLVAAVYRMAGLPAVAWLCAGLALVSAGLVLVLSRRLGANPFVAGVVLVAGSPLLIAWLAARPQLVDYAAVLVMVIMLRQIADGRAVWWPVAGIGFLSVLWVNLHAAALLGVVIAAGSAAVLLVRPATRRPGWGCAAAAAAALVGSFLNPLGVGVIGQTLRVQSASAGLVREWQPFSPASPMEWVVLTVGLTGLVIAIRRRDVVLGVAIGIAAAAGLQAIRMLPVLVLLALPVVASALSRPAALRYIRSRRVVLYAGAAVGAIVLAAIAGASLTHIGEPAPRFYPAAVVRDIPAGCRLFNTYLVGGFVILERPDVKVSIDSRNDVYGRQLLLQNNQTVLGKGNLSHGLAGAGCVLVPPASGLARRLYHDPAWTVRARDRIAVLFVRRASPGN